MYAKIVVVLFLIIIIYCLGSAMYFMLVGKNHPAAMVKALTWRVALSLCLFLLLLLGFYMGWFAPHGVV